MSFDWLRWQNRREDAVVLLCGMASFLQAFDGTALTPALVPIAKDLSTDPEKVLLIVACYLVAGTAVLPFSNWLVARFTGRTLLQFSFALFGVASLACAAAGGLEVMAAARVLQGIASGLMIPAARTVALHAVPENRTVRTVAMLSSPVTVALITGPLLGGLITAWWSWKAIFLINVPTTLVMGLAVWYLVPAGEQDKNRSFDWRGALLSTAAITCLTVALAGYPTAFGPGLLALFLGAGIGLLAVYLATWRRAADPVLDLSLFATHSFRAVMIAGLFARSASRAAPLLLGLYLEVGLHHSPVSAGALLMGTAVGALGARPALTTFIRRSSFRATLIWSTILSSLALAATAFIGPLTPLSFLLGLMVLQGFLRSIQNVGLSSMSLAGIERSQFGHAISLGTISQQLSGNLGSGLALLCLAASSRILGYTERSVGSYAAACILLGVVSAIAVPFLVGLRRGTGHELIS